MKDKEKKILEKRIATLEHIVNSLQTGLMKLSEASISNTITLRVQMSLLQRVLIQQALLDAKNPEVQAQAQLALKSQTPKSEKEKVEETYVT